MSSTIISSAIAPAAPVGVKQQYRTKSFGTTLMEATSTKTSAVKDLFKATAYVSKWAQLIDPKLPANYVAMGEVAINGKNLISGFEAITNGGAFVTNLFNSDPKAEPSAVRYVVIKNLCDFINNVGDFLKLLSRFFSIPHMKHVEGASGAFTLAGSINNLWEHSRQLLNPIKALTDEMQTYNNFYNGINVVSDVCYLAVGTMAVSMWLGLIVVPPAAVLLPLTIALICSLTNFFFKNMVNLNGQHPTHEEVHDALLYREKHVCVVSGGSATSETASGVTSTTASGVTSTTASGVTSTVVPTPTTNPPGVPTEPLPASKTSKVPTKVEEAAELVVDPLKSTPGASPETPTDTLTTPAGSSTTTT